MTDLANSSGKLNKSLTKYALIGGIVMLVYLILQGARMAIATSGWIDIWYRIVTAACYLLGVAMYFQFFRKKYRVASASMLLLTIAASAFFIYEIWFLYAGVVDFAAIVAEPRVSQTLYPLGLVPLTYILWKEVYIPRAFAFLHAGFIVVWLMMYFYVNKLAILVHVTFLINIFGFGAISSLAIWMIGIGTHSLSLYSQSEAEKVVPAGAKEPL